MEKSGLLKEYEKKAEDIKKGLESFKKLGGEKYIDEFMFCLLTPASNAKKCWEAVELLRKEDVLDEKTIKDILRKYTRFHNNKTRYMMNALKNWNDISKKIKDEKGKMLRNYLAEHIQGYGLKEAGHFLRNIGKSENEIAILDRHILRNMKESGIIQEEEIKGKKNYLEIEDKFLEFSKELGIPADELDLLFWSRETGEIFK